MKIEKIEFEGFDWDYGNFLHALQHDVPFAAIEKIFEKELLYFLDSKNSSSEPRWIAVGEVEPKRLAFVAFTIRTIGADRLTRPISARYIHRGSKEHKIYEEIRKKLLEK